MPGPKILPHVNIMNIRRSFSWRL